MESISLDKVLRNVYDKHVLLIREKNIELEREYFTQNSSSIPLSEIIEGTSYEDNFMYFKEKVKNGTDDEMNRIFIFLQDYFLFSYGHDMMFKKKLEADIFNSVPMEDFIYPKLSDAVKEKYNDVSVMRENPNFNANMEDIARMVFTYIEMQSLLYLLYWSDFQFPNKWEDLFPDTHKEILDILNSSGITIGDFLHALIDFKCKTMSEIFNEIGDTQLRKTYLEKVETLRKEKHEETNKFAHVKLPITYFLDHTLSDFFDMEFKTPRCTDTPTGAKKILLPNQGKDD